MGILSIRYNLSFGYNCYEKQETAGFVTEGLQHMA